MEIYHGSKEIIEKPKVHGSFLHNDYGPSFYLTVELESAKSWACKNEIIGIVNCYSVDDKKFKNLKILDLTDKNKYSVLNWLAILMHFRKLDSRFIVNNELGLKWLEKYYIDVNNFDVVIGYRADDSYFRFPISFISNDLSFEDLEEVYLSGNLGIQYAFMSEKAIQLLKFKKIINCETTFLNHYFDIVSHATSKFNEILALPKDPNKTYILDLMRRDNE